MIVINVLLLMMNLSSLLLFFLNTGCLLLRDSSGYRGISIGVLHFNILMLLVCGLLLLFSVIMLSTSSATVSTLVVIVVGFASSVWSVLLVVLLLLVGLSATLYLSEIFHLVSNYDVLYFQYYLYYIFNILLK